MTTSLLTAEQLEQYDRDGWVLLRGAAGPEILKLARIVLQRWADQTIESWVQRGLLSDPLRDLDFHHRLVPAAVRLRRCRSSGRIGDSVVVLSSRVLPFPLRQPHSCLGGLAPGTGLRKWTKCSPSPPTYPPPL